MIEILTLSLNFTMHIMLMMERIVDVLMIQIKRDSEKDKKEYIEGKVNCDG